MTTGAWRHYRALIREQRWRIAGALVLSIAQAALVLPIAWLVRHGFDVNIPAGDLLGLSLSSVAVLALYVLSDGLKLSVSYSALDITKAAITRLRGELIENLYGIPRARYGEADLARLHASIVQDTERLDMMTSSILARLLPAAASAVCLAAALWWLSWLLFLAILCLGPPIILAWYTLGTRLRERIAVFQHVFATFSKNVLFSLQMLELTRIQSAERIEAARHQTQMDELRAAGLSTAWLSTAYTLLQSEITAWSNIVVLCAGGALVVTQHLSIGGLIGFYFFLGLLRNNIGTCIHDWPLLVAGDQALARLWDFLRFDESRRYKGTQRIEFRGNIELRDVSFDYGRGRVFDHLSFKIAPGRATALVGPSGAGKTTIVNLILGLEIPQAGQLYAEGQSYDALDMFDLRRQVAVVLQDPWLFPGTIHENLIYGSATVSDQQLARAVALAGAEGFIAALPHGYDTWLGERGIVLSGGQRQRLAIARALLRDAPLLILDEPTHHLGTESIRELIRRVRSAAPETAVLLITHDRELLGEADQSYALARGQGLIHAQPAPVHAAIEENLAAAP